MNLSPIIYVQQYLEQNSSCAR